MKRSKKTIPIIIVVLCLLILIIDTKTVIAGAQDGIELCLKTLIPSLFPFFIVSSLFCMYCSALNASCLTPILRQCGVHPNCSSLLIIGLIGGYPTGAKAISEAYDRGDLSLPQARRMLGFCNNAGPAFIFGMIGRCFDSPAVCIIIQSILIVSALITGTILSEKSVDYNDRPGIQVIKSGNLMETNIKAMTSVCAWVILFRIVITFFEKWFLWMLPKELGITLIGTMELSNACISLNSIANDGQRFIIATGILSFGGLCVYMQTSAVTKNIGSGLYIPGKLLQSAISITLAIIAQYLLFPQNNIPIYFAGIPIFVFFALYISVKMYYKKTVAFSNKLVYNKRKKSAEARHAIS